MASKDSSSEIQVERENVLETGSSTEGHYKALLLALCSI
jgi:hypothetical protein